MRNLLDIADTLRAERGPKAARRSSSRAAFCLRLMTTTLAGFGAGFGSSFTGVAFFFTRAFVCFNCNNCAT